MMYTEDCTDGRITFDLPELYTEYVEAWMDWRGGRGLPLHLKRRVTKSRLTARIMQIYPGYVKWPERELRPVSGGFATRTSAYGDVLSAFMHGGSVEFNLYKIRRKSWASLSDERVRIILKNSGYKKDG